MAGSNEGNEGNEGNTGSLGRPGGGAWGVLPDRVDLPFIAESEVREQRLPLAGWRSQFWSGEWAAWLTLVDFAQTAKLPGLRPSTPTVASSPLSTNKGDGTCDVVGSGYQPSWQVGTYELRFKDVAGDGVFRLRDPRGRFLGDFPLVGGAVEMRREIVVKIDEGDAAFEEDDGFDITVSPGTSTIWLDEPVDFQTRLPVNVRITAQPNGAGKGTVTLTPQTPAYPGVRLGIYVLKCTASSATRATFKLTPPGSALPIATIKLRAADGSDVRVRNELGFTITSGSVKFAVNDQFDITVKAQKVFIVPRLIGNTGGGSCGYEADTLAPAGTQVGLYALRCVEEAASGGTFDLTGPDGTSLKTFQLSGGSASVTAPLVFTITASDAGFQLGDGFDIDIGGFDEPELRALIRAAEDERADALGEIVAQNDGFIAYFMSAMNISPRSYPNTCLLLHIGSLVGAFVSMHFKGIYQRQRPSQRAPGLMPPVPVPGHPSYPSGHSTQAHLMALCVQEALPAGAKKPLGDVIDRLAHRIARNREIAGLHFASDSRAGEDLARQALAVLKSDAMPKTLPQLVPPDVSPVPDRWRFRSIVAAAAKEWR